MNTFDAETVNMHLFKFSEWSPVLHIALQNSCSWQLTCYSLYRGHFKSLKLKNVTVVFYNLLHNLKFHAMCQVGLKLA